MAATPPHKSEVGNFNPSLPCNQDPTLLVALSRKERIQERISIYCPVVLAILALVTVVVVGVLAGERLLPYQQKKYVL
jgi:hypothetical protein